jgi:polyhydroxybutyrate depolymerase
MSAALALRALLLLLLCAVLAVLAGLLVPMRVNAANAPVAREGSFTFGGLTRTYRLYRPASLGAGRPVPLVLVLHGGLGTGAQAERAYRWDDAAEAHGFAVLYPDGVGRTWNAGECCGRARRDAIDDVGFLSALIDTVSAAEGIDSHRIYVTGMSNGAMMAYRLACESRVPFAAVGPVAGTLVSTCEHPHPVSLLAIHGLDDRNVPFAGGAGKGFDRSPRASVPDTLARWRTIDACGAPETRDAPPVRYQISACAAGRSVELITVAGAGHQWPGSVSRTTSAAAFLQPDPPSQALDATAVLWTFFSAHRT